MTRSNPFPDAPQAERHLAYAFETIGEDRFRVAPITSGLLRLFGGMIVSQCLAAAQRTVPEDKMAHSLHAYFGKPGRVDRPNEFTVSRELDGRTFANRLVRMSQDGLPLMNCMVSFKTPETSAHHAMAMPAVPAPEDLPRLEDIMAERGDALPERHRPFWQRRQQIDWRPVEPFPFETDKPLSASRHFWFRFHGPVEGDLPIHQRLLAYASDQHIFHTGLRPLGIDWTDPHLQTASLDHAIWFHDRFRVDDWLLYALDAPAAGNALAMGRGAIFRRDGALVATVSQQGLARILNERREDKL